MLYAHVVTPLRNQNEMMMKQRKCSRYVARYEKNERIFDAIVYNAKARVA